MANEDVIAELPEYYAHKPVRAAKVSNFWPMDADRDLWTLEITLPDKTTRELEVDRTWMDRQEPDIGGWLVVGTDGQLAYSKGVDFEPSFVKDAVITQKGGKDVFSREHLFVRNSQGELVPAVVEMEPLDG